MSDPWDDRLRRAIASGADRFVPAEALGATRTALVGRVRRRQRQVASSLAVAAMVLLVAGASVAAGIGRPAPSSRQVAAGGSPAGQAGGPSVTFTPGPPGGATSSSTATVAPVATTVARGTTTTTVPPTRPPTTTPATTAPPTTAPVSGASAVQGEVLFSPTCPVQRFPPDPACAPKPGPAHIELMAPGGAIAAQGNAAANGQFNVPVAPGHYTVVAAKIAANPSIGQGCMVTPAQVIVGPGARTTVSVSCDTGIR